jgi:alpha-L-fucosidase 2
MLLYSRPGHLELLPALPEAWSKSGAVTGIGARGGFVVDLRWRDGRPAEATIRSVGGRTTTVSYGGMSRKISLKPGEATVLREFGR